MKKFYLLLFSLIAAAILFVHTYPVSFEPEARAATGAIYVDGKFHCSGTEIGPTLDGAGVFLTARHCVADPETNHISEHLVISFSDNQKGPYYDARPIAISLTDDLALLVLTNGADIPYVNIRDERRLRNNDPIFNISFPLSTGKELFHGRYMRQDFPSFPAEMLSEYPMWLHAMPMQLDIAHGSSGSGVFSERQRALIGVAVGTFGEGSYNIAIPADRVLDFINDLQDNTVTKFAYANPEKQVSFEDLIIFLHHHGINEN